MVLIKFSKILHKSKKNNLRLIKIYGYGILLSMKEIKRKLFMNPIIISIVTHNSEDIFQTLDQFATFLPNEQYQLVIFDNHSNSEYIARLKKYAFVKLILSDENRGFGYGHNQVLLTSPEKIGVICNPDILVTKEALDEMIRLLKKDTSLAGVSPKVLNADGSTQYLIRHKLTVFDYFLRFIPFKSIKKFFNKRLSGYECRDLPNDQYSYVRMSSGCFLVVDIDKFKQITGFDERFFMYFEDNDLCLRFEQAGYKLLYSPFETVVHLYGKGSHRSFKLFIVFLQSMARFFNKWGWRFF